MKEKKKNISSIFDNCHETASQEIFLKRCGFARAGEVPPDTEPSVGVSPPLNDRIAPHTASDESETDSVIGSGYNQWRRQLIRRSGSGYNEDVVESHAIRLVSPEESVETVDLEDDAADQNVEDVARDVPVESNVGGGGDGEKSSNLMSSGLNPSSSGNRRDETLGSREKKLKIPLRDIVKAIVMNSRNTEEEEIGRTSFVQILMDKGFKFP